MSQAPRPNPKPGSKSGSKSGSKPKSRAVPSTDALMDAYFDGALTEGGREYLLESIKNDPKRCEQMARTQRFISMLKQPIAPVPDQSSTILDRVGRSRGFLSARGRRRVLQGRLAVGGSILASCLALGLLWRAWPGMAIVPKPAPVSAVVSKGSAAATQTIDRLNGAMRSLMTPDVRTIETQPHRRIVTYIVTPVSFSPLESIVPVELELDTDADWTLPGGSGAIALATSQTPVLPFTDVAASRGGSLGGGLASAVDALAKPQSPAPEGDGVACAAWPGAAAPRRVMLDLVRGKQNVESVRKDLSINADSSAGETSHCSGDR